MNADGSFDYVPNPDSYGVDSFTYTITDTDGTTSTATVTITVDSVNDPPVSPTVRVELSEEDATAYGGTDVSVPKGLLSMASDPDDPDDKSLTIESVSLAQIASESDDSLLVGTFKTQLDAVINIYEDGSFIYDASNVDFIKELDKGQSIEDSLEFQIIDESGGKSKLVNAIITINGNAYEGDINNDLSVDILDFQMAGQYLVGLTTIPNDSIMAAVDCYPINEGGNDIINISDWVQVGRFALGLDAIKTKAYVGEQDYVAGKQTPLNASGQSTGVSQPVRRMQPLNFVQGGATQLGFVSSSDSASAGDSMDFSLVLKNAAEASGLSFTMKFDPDELLISEGAIELSDEAKAEGFGVMLNANQANAGLIGVLIYAQPGELLGLSNAPLLQLKAEVLANHPQKRAEMKIVDWPVKSMASSISNRKVPLELVVELPMIKPITNYDDWADVIQQPVGNVESVIDVSDPDGDADGDGISNHLEFVFASNPYEKSSIAAYSTDKGSKDGSSQTLTISTAYMAERGLVDFTFKAVGSLGSLTKGNDSLKPLVNSSVVGGLVHESITLPLDGSMGFITYEIKVMP
jgi:VCBS repeat-containing protein